MAKPMPFCELTPENQERVQDVIDRLYANTDAITCSENYRRGYRAALYRIAKDLDLDVKHMQELSPLESGLI